MEDKRLNFFIVDTNLVIDEQARMDLEQTFGSKINLFFFYDEESCLREINDEIDSIIMIYAPGEMADAHLELLKTIRAINPNTKVIVHPSGQNIGRIIESLNVKPNDTEKNERTRAKLLLLINKYITDPIRMFPKEFKISKYTGVFLLTFFMVGVLVIVFLISGNR